MKIARVIASFVVLLLITLVTYKVCHAAAAVVVQTAGGTADTSILDLLRPVYDALTSGRFAYGAALGLIALTALTKRYLGGAIPWLHTDAGGSLLVLVGAGATAAATSLALPDTKVTFSLIENAAKTGIFAAGGYAMIKNLVIAPLLPRLPSWAQKLLAPIMWIFDGSMKPAEVVQAELAKSTAAGAAAVEAKPATGVIGIVGAPTDVK